MNGSVWWLTSDYYGRLPGEIPAEYLRLGVRSDWLFKRDRVLWEEFVAELRQRGMEPPVECRRRC